MIVIDDVEACRGGIELSMAPVCELFGTGGAL